jgi:hypothetical protein
LLTEVYRHLVTRQYFSVIVYLVTCMRDVAVERFCSKNFIIVINYYCCLLMKITYLYVFISPYLMFQLFDLCNFISHRHYYFCISFESWIFCHKNVTYRCLFWQYSFPNSETIKLNWFVWKKKPYAWRICNATCCINFKHIHRISVFVVKACTWFWCTYSPISHFLPPSLLFVSPCSVLVRFDLLGEVHYSHQLIGKN